MASTFANSLGLSLHQEQIGFVIGIVLILVGCFFFAHSWRTRASERNKLLEACYKDGQELQQRLVKRKFFDAKEAENEARTAVYLWAEKTWKVLKQHFPGREQDFLGQGPMLGANDNSNIFNTYCEMEVQRLGDSAAVFLESKLRDIGCLLTK